MKTPKTVSVETIVLTLLFFVISSVHHVTPAATRDRVKPSFKDYQSFVSSYSQKEDPIAEIYGQYSAKQSSKRIRAKFNLLIDPGKRAYVEILDPSDRLLNVLSLSQDKIALLWPKENAYIEEKPTPENLRAVIGLPVNADDALQLISGRGLQFNAWEEAEALKDGWKLIRGPASAVIIVKENLSKIETNANQGKLLTYYEKYEFLSDKSLPTRIRFELPQRKSELELRIQKYLPRTEEPTPDLFEIKLPQNAKKLALKEIYHGKPLLLE